MSRGVVYTFPCVAREPQPAFFGHSVRFDKEDGRVLAFVARKVKAHDSAPTQAVRNGQTCHLHGMQRAKVAQRRHDLPKLHSSTFVLVVKHPQAVSHRLHD